MAIAYESVAEVDVTTVTTIQIAKPSGLAVGDTMFAQLWSRSGSTYTTLSGWSVLYSATPSLAGASQPCSVFYKTADSGDVAASTFDFTNGTSTVKSGAIIRVSGF